VKYLVWKQYEEGEPYVYHVGLTLEQAQEQTRYQKKFARNGWETEFRAGYRLMTEDDWAWAESEGIAGWNSRGTA